MWDDSYTARAKAHLGEALRWNRETEFEFAKGIIAGLGLSGRSCSRRCSGICRSGLPLRREACRSVRWPPDAAWVIWSEISRLP
jgi:hypothetical protein